MKLRWKLGIAISVALISIVAVCWFTSDYCRFWIYEAYQFVRPIPPHCKQRGADFEARVNRIKADAKTTLQPGAKRADVTGFFASENIPVAFIAAPDGKHEAEGTIYVKGDASCSSGACGDDSALIGVRVELDESGTVQSAPVVVGMYTNCL